MTDITPTLSKPLRGALTSRFGDRQLRTAGLSYSLGITLENQMQVGTNFLATIFATTVCMHANSFESCPTLCDPVDCSPPGSSVHGILQARKLKWVAVPSSRGSTWPRDWNHFPNVSCIYDQCQDKNENRNLLWNIQKHFNLSFHFRRQVLLSSNLTCSERIKNMYSECQCFLIVSQEKFLS